MDCEVCGKVKYALVPWSRYNCSFTLEFEKYVLALAKEMPVKSAARLGREHDTRLWRIVHFYVDKALSEQDLSGVTRIAVDETSSRRGHNYVTIVLDSDERKVIFATEGKGSDTIRDFKEHLEQHQGDPEQIEEYCSDMSPAFIGGMAKEFPGAELTVDKFHVMKLINDALGVRPTERIRRILIQNQCSHAFESNDYAYNIRRLSTGFVSSDGLLI